VILASAIRATPRRLDWQTCRAGRSIALLHARCETAWFRIWWRRATAILLTAKRLTFVRPDGTPCTTHSGERANSGAPPVLVAFGDYDAMRLQQFASEHGSALVDGWKLFGVDLHGNSSGQSIAARYRGGR
jgi:hypothetical protein